MKLLHVAPGVGLDQGGIATAIVGIVKALGTAGDSCEIATLASRTPDIAGLEHTTIHRFARTGRITASSPGLKSWLRAHVREYDAVVAHSIWLEPMRYALHEAARANVPAYAMAHGMLDPNALAWHGLRKWVRWQTGVRRELERATVVFTCELERERALAHRRAGLRRTLVLPLPIDVPELAAVAREDFLLSMSRVHPRKAVLEGVQALALLHKQGLDIRAVHLGHIEDAAYAERVKALAAESLPQGAFTLAGAHNAPHVQDLLARCRMLWVPTHAAENFGMSIMEGLAAGVPVLASRVALLVPGLESASALRGTSSQPSQMAADLAALWRDQAARDDLSARGRAHVLKYYTHEAVGRAWRDALRT